MTENNKNKGASKLGGGTLKLNLGQSVKVDPLKSISNTPEIKKNSFSNEKNVHHGSYNNFRNNNNERNFNNNSYKKNDGRLNKYEEEARFDALKNRNQSNVYNSNNQSLSKLLASKNNIDIEDEEGLYNEEIEVKSSEDQLPLNENLEDDLMKTQIDDNKDVEIDEEGRKIEVNDVVEEKDETVVEVIDTPSEQKVVKVIKNDDEIVKIEGVREAKIKVAATHKDFKLIKSKEGEDVKEYVSTLNARELLEKRRRVEEMEKEERERARIAALRDKKKNENLRAGLLTISTDDNDIQGDMLNKPWIRKKPKSNNRNFKNLEKEMIVQEVVIDDKISIKDLASMMNVKAFEVAKVLGKMEKKRFDENHILNPDIAELLVLEFGHTPIMKAFKTIDSLIKERINLEKNLKERPPVVTIMGHVDHGKTSLLDAFRKSNVVASESGGITQHIGAYQIVTKSGKKISFIDTPGHEAFTAMRARGAQATDIVILVVAADDGVMPQTIESINHIKASGAPMIVAINKIDRISGEPTSIMNQLLQHDVVVEQLGGEIMAIPISAKNKTNLDKLEEAILLQAEFMELKADYDIKACGLVIESKVNNAKGVCATLLVQHGTLRVGDSLITNDKFCKVRVMNDEWGKPVKNAEPSMSVEVFGFQEAPALGQRFIVMSNEKEAKATLEELERASERQKATKTREESGKINIFNILSGMQNEDEKELKFVIKADVAGTIDAVKYSLEKLNSDSLKIKVIHAATGTVTESDVSLAKTSGAIIAGFNINVSSSIMNLVSREKILLRTYKIIYQLIDDVKDMIENKLKPQEIEKYIGKLVVKQIFDIGGVGKIAGCLVVDSLITTQSLIRIRRKDKIISEGIKINILKRLKEDVREVKQGLECAVGLKDYEDIQAGDTLEAYTIVENK
jgi:translation initiation factor IF-2